MSRSWTRIETRRPYPPPAELRTVIAQVLDAYGQIGTQHIRTVEWAITRFRKPTGRSTRAWKHLVNKERLYLTIYNDAENRYGTRYAPYVHLSGRPRSDRLFAEVVTYVSGPLGKTIARAVSHAYIQARKKAKPTTVRTEAR